MLRKLQETTGKVYDAMRETTVDLVVGMGVVKDYATGKVGFPIAATDKGVFLVEKEKKATGIYAGAGELSDYEDIFMNIKVGEKVKLDSPVKAERYATDQIVLDGLVMGDYLAVGTNGKFEKSETATRFVYGGAKTIDRHVLHVVEVVE